MKWSRVENGLLLSSSVGAREKIRFGHRFIRDKRVKDNFPRSAECIFTRIRKYREPTTVKSAMRSSSKGALRIGNKLAQ